MPFDQEPQFKADLACRVGVCIVGDYTDGGVLQLPLRPPSDSTNRGDRTRANERASPV